MGCVAKSCVIKALIHIPIICIWYYSTNQNFIKILKFCRQNRVLADGSFPEKSKFFAIFSRIQKSNLEITPLQRATWPVRLPFGKSRQKSGRTHARTHGRTLGPFQFLVAGLRVPLRGTIIEALAPGDCIFDETAEIAALPWSLDAAFKKVPLLRHLSPLSDHLRPE